MGGTPRKSELDKLLAVAPVRAPDLTDEVVQAAAKAQRKRTGMTRRSTFLSGPLGDVSTPSLGRTTLLGS